MELTEEDRQMILSKRSESVTLELSISELQKIMKMRDHGEESTMKKLRNGNSLSPYDAGELEFKVNEWLTVYPTLEKNILLNHFCTFSFMQHFLFIDLRELGYQSSIGWDKELQEFPDEFKLFLSNVTAKTILGSLINPIIKKR